MLLAAYQNKAWREKCQSKSYSIACYCISYCTSLATEPTKTLHWGTTTNCLQYNTYMSWPITAHINYKDTVCF